MTGPRTARAFLRTHVESSAEMKAVRVMDIATVDKNGLDEQIPFWHLYLEIAPVERGKEMALMLMTNQSDNTVISVARPQ